VERAAWALARKNRAPGVTLLRYVFQLYAVGDGLLNRPDRDTLLKTGRRRMLASVGAPVPASGRIVGVSEC
jgi:hypothetical protein